MSKIDWNDKEAVKSYNKTYLQNNRARHNELSRIYLQTNEKARQWRKDYMKVYNKIYTEKNRHKYNAKRMKRHAAKLQRTPKWLTDTNWAQIELFYAASKQLSTEFGIPMNVDHIIPLQGKNVSGLHVPWNLQVITEEANNKKRNKVLQ